MGFTANSVSVDDMLYFFSAIDWLRDNTDFSFGEDVSVEDISNLPHSAKLFIIKFISMLKSGVLSGSNVTSESIGGMSKSYDSSINASASLWQIAKELLGKHLTKGKAKSFGLEQENNMYITKEGTYVQNAITKEWVKANNEVAKKQTESQKDPTSFDTMLEIMNSVEKNLTVEEKDSEYEITYSGNDDAVKEALKKALSNNQQDLGQVLDNIKLDKLELKYKVDKKTFMPKEYEVKTTIKYPNKDKETVFQMELKVEFSEINEVKGLTIPDEVKNAE